ncbi:unnamed protein product [Blepharisma stoltei]|uniref:Uncharacterized protein n=1 Tax=Blepharisma stoltei TaxID=1481888 RepID=A0AAU9ISR5_9CILI|nr:unnamed protein product [Blepharisma stoltei]
MQNDVYRNPEKSPDSSPLNNRNFSNENLTEFSSSPLLVPLRTKFRSSRVREVNGWRKQRPIEEAKNELSIGSNLPYQVRSKSEINKAPRYPHHEKLPRIIDVPRTKHNSTKQQKYVSFVPGVLHEFPLESLASFGSDDHRKSVESVLYMSPKLNRENSVPALTRIKDTNFKIAPQLSDIESSYPKESMDSGDITSYITKIQNLGSLESQRASGSKKHSKELKETPRIIYSPKKVSREPGKLSYVELYPFSENNEFIHEIHQKFPGLHIDILSVKFRNQELQTSFMDEIDKSAKEELFHALFDGNLDRETSFELHQDKATTLLDLFLKALLKGEIKNKKDAQEFVDSQIQSGVLIERDSISSAKSSHNRRQSKYLLTQTKSLSSNEENIMINNPEPEREKTAPWLSRNSSINNQVAIQPNVSDLLNVEIKEDLSLEEEKTVRRNSLDTVENFEKNMAEIEKIKEKHKSLVPNKPKLDSKEENKSPELPQLNIEGQSISFERRSDDSRDSEKKITGFSSNRSSSSPLAKHRRIDSASNLADTSAESKNLNISIVGNAGLEENNSKFLVLPTIKSEQNTPAAEKKEIPKFVENVDRLQASPSKSSKRSDKEILKSDSSTRSKSVKKRVEFSQKSTVSSPTKKKNTKTSRLKTSKNEEGKKNKKNEGDESEEGEEPKEKIKAIDKFIKNFTGSLLSLVQQVKDGMFEEHIFAEKEPEDEVEESNDNKQATDNSNSGIVETEISVNKVESKKAGAKTRKMVKKKTPKPTVKNNEEIQNKEKKEESLKEEEKVVEKEEIEQNGENPSKIKKEPKTKNPENAKKRPSQYFTKKRENIPINFLNNSKPRQTDSSEGEVEFDTSQEKESISRSPISSSASPVHKIVNPAEEREKRSVEYELKHMNLMSQMAKELLVSQKAIPNTSNLLNSASSEFFKNITPAKKSARQPIIPQITEEYISEEEENPWEEERDVDEELEIMFRDKKTSVKKFMFSPPIQYRFPQKYDLAQEVNLNEIAVSNQNVDPEVMETHLSKQKFLEDTIKIAEYKDYAKKQKGLLYVVNINEKAPDEQKREWRRDYEKKKKREKERRSKTNSSGVTLRGKPKITFSGLEESKVEKKHRMLQASRSISCSDIEIIKSGGALDVKSEMEAKERIYCRLKGVFDLNSLKGEFRERNWIPNNFKENLERINSVLQFPTCR